MCLSRICSLFGFIAFTTTLYISGCSTSDKNPLNDDDQHTGFSGITVTDSVGNIISVDSDDWCLDSVPLFASQDDSGVVVIDDSLAIYWAFGPAYPNPIRGFTTVEFTVADTTRAAIWITDGKGYTDTLFINDHTIVGTYTLVWDATLLPVGIYRFYAEAGDWSCHGDVERLEDSQ